MKIDASSEGARVQFFSDLYSHARNFAENIYADMEKFREQYRGSEDIDGSDVKAGHVRNITYELIESQVTGYLPNPVVSPKVWNERNERNAKSIEKLLTNKRNELPFEELNDIDERFSPIYGSSVWLVEWDESITTKNTVGDVKITCLSPKKFTGQPGIYRIDDMEYCFIEFDTTKDDIVRKYGVSPEKADETERDPSRSNDDDNTATVYVCYYKDDSDNVCEYIWSGEAELSSTSDYYARKRRVCRKCGKKEALCECEDPDIELENEEYEELTDPIYLSDGTIIPALSPVIKDGAPVTKKEKRQAVDTNGKPVFERSGNVLLPVMAEADTVKKEPTRLPFYKPKSFPVKIRKNTSAEESLFGQSDCEFIRPQQQAVNKLESRIMEKLISSGVYPIVPEGYRADLDSSIFKLVLRARPETANLFGRVDLSVNVAQDTAAAERHYDHAKRILGISDSFQGQYDSSAHSGKAKQLQIQQAQGRLDSKRRMKNALYAELDKTIFEYYLAFADELRTASYRDAQGRWQNVSFNRYDFLEMDENGEYYYNDEYLFAADATVDLESTRELIWQENRENFRLGAYGDPAIPQTQLIFWQNMERAHYPHAQENVERLRDEIQRQQELARKQAEVNALGGEIETRKEYEEMLKRMIGGK